MPPGAKHRLKKFLEANIEVLDAEDFNTLYDKMDKEVLFMEETGLCTMILLESDIDLSSLAPRMPRAFLYLAPIEEFNIPDYFTNISQQACYSCKQLKTVTIPTSITSIGAYAFQNCIQLEEVTVPNSVEVIGVFAFAGSGCKRVVLGDQLQVVPTGLFASCDELVDIKLPAHALYIGDRVFSDCTSLNQITIPDTVQEIGDQTFQYCANLREVVLPRSVHTMGRSVFAHTPLTTITYQGTMTDFRKQGFARLKTWRKDSSITSVKCFDGIIELK